MTMRKVKALFFSLVFLMLVGALSYFIFKYYGYIFAKEIRGEVVKVEKITSSTVNEIKDSPTLHQFAVAVKELESREIFTAVSTDCQWAVVSKGYCVVTRFMPYPFWNLKKHGNFSDARLLRLMECKNSKNKKTELKKTTTLEEIPESTDDSQKNSENDTENKGENNE